MQPAPAIELEGRPSRAPTWDREHVAPAPDRRLAATAALVAAAYYVGANIGLILRFPPTTPSVLWPPNSILTAALLLTPVRAWWVLLLAAFPAHLAAELPAGWPPLLVVALFVTNCLEAVVAAGLVRRYSDDPTRFDTLRRAGVFIVAAGMVAPLVSTFADAAAVWLVRAEPYGHVFVTRLSSNVLTALTLVPTIVATATAMPTRLRRASAVRRIEAVVLSVGVCALTLVVFGFRGFAGTIPGAPVTPVVFLLPCVLWATVRFGPAGTSAALLATALLASWAATYGTGPFAGLRAAESVLALQMSLVVVAIPMLCLAALIEERRRAERELVERLGFEEVLSRLSGAFVHVPSAEMTRAFDRWLAQLGAFLGLTRVTLSLVGDGAPTETVASVWTAPDRDARVVEADITLLLTAGTGVLGTLSVATRVGADAGSAELRRRIRLIAEVFANALARKHAEMDAQETRQELAHFTRVSAMGELAASLAHELNQPLTGILINAQTARRFLDLDPPAVGELREILADIIADDTRAAEVIRRLRELLRKGETERVPLDLNVLIRDVIRLVTSDAVIRNVTLTFAGGAEPLLVRGDRIQLQQVVLNLLLNAMEAVADGGAADRRVDVVTEKRGAVVCVSIRDGGPGLRDGTSEIVFEPFYTTKPNGMGMGLAIVRSIVRMHDGTISVVNEPDGGATFRVELPSADEEAT